MQSVLIVFHLIIVAALVVVVLLQRSEGGAIGIGGGGFMTGRAQANVLTRATSILAALFFATSLGLTVLAGWSRPKTTIFDNVKELPAQAAPAAPAETSPSSLLDQLKRMEGQGASAPAPAPAPGAPPAAPAPAAPAPEAVPESK
jgi:preprotein translocase subunit SecG